MEHKPRVALLIDADNSPASKIDSPGASSRTSVSFRKIRK